MSVRTVRAPAVAVLAAVCAVAVGVGIATAATPQAAPKVEPLHANFVQSAFATFYTIKVEAPPGTSLRYEWSLKPPAADPACDTFAQVKLNPASAVWHHGDQDGCDHTKTGPQGHPGTVTVTITALPFVCTATFLGTETADGPAATCVDQRPAAPTHTIVSPKLIPHLVNTSEDPAMVYKRVMGELSKENLQTAKDGGLFSFIPYFKDAVKGTAGLKEKDTFVEVILEKVGLSKLGLGTAAVKKGFAVVSIVGDVSAITFNVAALYQGWQAADPPRSDFQVVATAAQGAVSLPPSLTADAPAPVVSAANALLTNAFRLRNVNAALLTTFERVQGAYKARDAKAEATQAAAGAALAETAADLTAAQPALAAALAAAARAVGGSFTMPGPLVAAVSKGRSGIPAELTGLFGQFKLTPAELGPVQAQVLAPTTGSFVFPDFMATPQAAATAKAAAKGLRGFAAFLRDIATGKAA